ncbi:MAG: hypothetical protein LQ350_004829 [Teloschistes chrysophthalmus]|nr:MAG: hypothetical protein LQ350_004829 [Niorma chrysophthalma]
MASAFGLTILLPLTLELVRWAIAQSTATTATRNTIQESQASLVVDTDDAPDSFIVTTTTMTVAMLDDGPEGLSAAHHSFRLKGITRMRRRSEFNSRTLNGSAALESVWTRRNHTHRRPGQRAIP